MVKKNREYLATSYSVLACLILLLLTSCASSPDFAENYTVSSANGLFEGSVYIADGQFELSGPFLGSSSIRGTVLQGAFGYKLLRTEELRWFNNWSDGWTEGVFILEGELELRKEGQHWILLSPPSPPSWEYAQEVAIRYRDSILRGSEALSLMDRRYSRIEATLPFLKEHLGEQYYSLFKPVKRNWAQKLWDSLRGKKGENNEKAFYPEASTLLFPEVYGNVKGSTIPEPVEEDRIRGEGFTWNAAYSRSIFPEELREVRNTGTLFRDWEETAELFYLRYQWDALWARY